MHGPISFHLEESIRAPHYRNAPLRLRDTWITYLSARSHEPTGISLSSYRRADLADCDDILFSLLN